MNLFRRKMLSAFLTALFASVAVTLITPPDILLGEHYSYVDNLLVVTGYVFVGVFVYGVPFSVLMDLITKSWGPARFFFSFAFHIIGGLLPFFVLWFFTLHSLVIAVLFFLIDEGLRQRRKHDVGDVSLSGQV
ncbi:hypothetical protein [Halobacillus salinus]|uniref:Uncharacterized protein n=1 Tax=Halobacillus salinus TaxID=192814 RepID=A0A4Z0H3C7_9BACI|nr:hypothetical protein [Halobacillus salinus]TGB03685.1 hypothetical protein E4663_01385 [Halobacillus salinus]